MRNYIDKTILTFRAYMRTGLDADVLLQSSVDSLGVVAENVEQTIIYVPVSFSDLMEVEKSTLFVIDYNDQKCHVIRQWVVTFKGILEDLPITPGCTDYRLSSVLELSGEPV